MANKPDPITERFFQNRMTEIGQHVWNVAKALSDRDETNSVQAKHIRQALELLIPKPPNQRKQNASDISKIIGSILLGAGVSLFFSTPLDTLKIVAALIFTILGGIMVLAPFMRIWDAMFDETIDLYRAQHTPAAEQAPTVLYTKHLEVNDGTEAEEADTTPNTKASNAKSSKK